MHAKLLLSQQVELKQNSKIKIRGKNTKRFTESVPPKTFCQVNKNLHDDISPGTPGKKTPGLLFFLEVSIGDCRLLVGSWQSVYCKVLT